MRKSYNEIRFRKLVNDFGDAVIDFAITPEDSALYPIKKKRVIGAKLKLIMFMDSRMQDLEELRKEMD